MLLRELVLCLAIGKHVFGCKDSGNCLVYPSGCGETNKICCYASFALSCCCEIALDTRDSATTIISFLSVVNSSDPVSSVVTQKNISAVVLGLSHSSQVSVSTLILACLLTALFLLLLIMFVCYLFCKSELAFRILTRAMSGRLRLFNTH